MQQSFKRKVLNSTIWSGVERFSTQIIQFLFNVLIARILLPSDYGIVAMLGIFLAVSQCFVYSGFSSALIRKNNRSEVDFSTVFYYNLFVSIFLYLILYLLSPIIANFYHQPLLVKILRISGLALIINAISGVQHAKLSIALDFKARAKIAMTCAIVSGSIGLILAYQKCGVWALVTQSLSYTFLCCVLLCLKVRWRPLFVFSYRSFKELFGFGSKILASSLIDTLYNNLYSLVIGKIFTPKALGLYSRADSLAQFPSINITNAIQNVAYPALCSIKDNKIHLKSAYIKMLRMSAFIVFPLMLGLSSVAKPFIHVVLTDKWIELSPYLKILCFSLMWFPVQSLNLSILQVEGRSDLFLKLEIYKKVIGVITLCITIQFGLLAMCYGRLFNSFISLYLNSLYTKKIIHYGITEQFKDILHIVIHAVIMFIIVSLVVRIIPNHAIKLLAGVTIGGVYYLLGAYIMKFSELFEIVSFIRNKS